MQNFIYEFLLLLLDTYRSHNFWSGPFQRLEKLKIQSIINRNPAITKVALKGFWELMSHGFQRRFHHEQNDFQQYIGQLTQGALGKVNENPVNGGFDGFFQQVGRQISNQYALTQSQAEQWQAIQQARYLARSPFVRMLPSFIHPYIDYFQSLYKAPNRFEMIRGILLGLFLSVVTVLNTGRRAFTFTCIGNLIPLSILLSRGMPTKKPMPGMPLQNDRRSIFWSMESFYTATALTAMFSIPVVLLTRGIIALFFSQQIPVQYHWMIPIAAGILSTNIGTSYYEVYESSTQGGSRWRKAVSQYSSPESLVTATATATATTATSDASSGEPSTTPSITPAVSTLSNGLNIGNANQLYSIYADEYYPDRDDIRGLVSSSKPWDKLVPAYIPDMDEIEYEKWRDDRTDARLPPMEDFDEASIDLGVKKTIRSNQDSSENTNNNALRDFSVDDDTPRWIGQHVEKSTLAANAWREIKTTFERDYSEFSPIFGPAGFRDKTPEWVKLFGKVWAEKTASRRAMARDYGSYRKTMWRTDPDVVIQPYDGVKDFGKKDEEEDEEDEDGEGGGGEDGEEKEEDG
jgi:hypothetical protein